MTPLITPHSLYSYRIHLSHLSQETCLFLPSAARTLEGCARDAHMNRPITAKVRTSCHAAGAACITEITQGKCTNTTRIDQSLARSPVSLPCLAVR
ncbi:hypothetical protein Y032_0004g1758 [Ancylostoma ceylanicum]|uniref:Uncharacterized protein n=1 Tax=Ancylostoma ceylanicum TaxID=53326 RepID=A0A016VT41_9BILA|nr:hypothetical protein Y032_0004g1758 [Ancylostoma ceylanicum]